MSSTYYLRTELFSRPAVTEAQAATNRELARRAAAAGRRREFNRPLKPRPAQRGIFPLNQSAFHEWLKAGKIPPPDTVLGRRPVWRAETIHKALREMGLPVPGERQESDSTATA